MRGFKHLAFFILFSFSMAYASAMLTPIQVKLCELRYEGQHELYYFASEQYRRIQTASKNARLKAILEAQLLKHINQYHTAPNYYEPMVATRDHQDEFLPIFRAQDAQLEDHWALFLSRYKETLTNHIVEFTNFADREDIVLIFFGEDIKVFRTADVFSMGAKKSEAYGMMRRTYLADLINHFMRLSVVPDARLALFNGRMGILSDFAEGMEIESVEDLQNINPGQLADSKAFEFLMGNIDVHGKNIRINHKGEIKVIDHDRALYPFLIQARGYDAGQTWMNYFWGDQLPEYLTARFVEGLNRLTVEVVTERWGQFMTDLEIQGLMLRRKLLLLYHQMQPFAAGPARH